MENLWNVHNQKTNFVRVCINSNCNSIISLSFRTTNSVIAIFDIKKEMTNQLVHETTSKFELRRPCYCYTHVENTTVQQLLSYLQMALEHSSRTRTRLKEIVVDISSSRHTPHMTQVIVIVEKRT